MKGVGSEGRRHKPWKPVIAGSSNTRRCRDQGEDRSIRSRVVDQGRVQSDAVPQLSLRNLLFSKTVKDDIFQISKQIAAGNAELKLSLDERILKGQATHHQRHYQKDELLGRGFQVKWDRDHTASRSSTRGKLPEA